MSSASRAAEHRASEGVGVEQAEFVGSEAEAAACIGELLDTRGEKHELGLLGLAQGEQAELIAAVDGRKHRFAVFDVVKADQPRALGDVGKKRLGAVVGGNAGGHDETGAARGRHQLREGFGKQGVGVHIAHAGEWVAAAVVARDMGEQAHGLGAAAGGDELGVEALFGGAFLLGMFQLGEQVACQHALGQPLNALAAFGLVPGLGHVAVAGGEEFFFLQLDAFPRRVAQHAVKAPRREHLRKRQWPVQHAGLDAGGVGGGTLRLVQGAGRVGEQFQIQGLAGRNGRWRRSGEQGEARQCVGVCYLRGVHLGQQKGADQQIGGVGEAAVLGLLPKRRGRRLPWRQFRWACLAAGLRAE